MGSMKPSLETFQKCMEHADSVRNVCILAHVDHGKTTIADTLLATNRIVSKRMAGLVRYLDDRIDEQERGITMKSSTVSLVNSIEGDLLLLNLIDTPGHIDFSTEVGAALRVCDGALIVVDLVEGVCVQTRESIKQSFSEKCKMILVLNKIDKLIVDLRKEPSEIFQTIIQAIENCNAIVAELYQYECGNSDIDIENTGLLFSPDNGNVIFASAIDGWGFTIKSFAKMFINLIKGESIESLNDKLWNFDAYVDSKTNTIKLGAIDKNKTNVFIQLCLKTISYIYTAIVIQMDKSKVPTIRDKLNIINITRDMNHTDSKIQLKAIMQAWSSLAEIILLQCKEVISPPSKINENKIRYLLDYHNYYEDKNQNSCIEMLVKLFKHCPSDSESVVYVSKMFCVSKKNLSQNKPKVFMPKSRTNNQLNDESKNIHLIENETKTIEPDGNPNGDERDFSIIALGRVFAGTLRIGQEMYVLPNNYVPNKHKNVEKIIIKELYILFGRELVLVDSVAAGNICGIGSLESVIVRTATLSSNLNCVSFVEPPSFPPIVRNAIEPVNPKDLPVLRQGLRILMQTDSCVQVIVQETGEHVLLTAGDVHLAKCLEDLSSKFAKIEINVSSPMVSLRETVNCPLTKSDLRKNTDNYVLLETSLIKLSVIVVSVPENIASVIEKNFKLIKILDEHQQISSYDLIEKREKSFDLNVPKRKLFKNDVINNAVEHLRKQINCTFDSHDNWSKFKNNIWTISKMGDNTNLLINSTNYYRNIFDTLDERDQRSCFDQFIMNAFNNCCKSGPICDEPLRNCAFIVTDFELNQCGNIQNDIKANVNIELNVYTLFREAIEKQPQRLLEPMFTTSIQVNTNILGKVYSVINKRHGKVLDAVGMDDQEKTFLVKAQIPVVESTGFANEIRKTTSGQAIPNLKFSHFEIIDGDPHYKCIENYDEEVEEGINLEAAVRATKLRKEIRKRKGLHVEEQVVVYAEKQRTLNKKK